MPEPLTFFLLLPLSSLFFFSKTSHGNALASNCPSTECGDVKIHYPFWLQSDATAYQYCGYPGFNFTCSDQETIFNLHGESFYVKDISYTDYTLALVNVEVSSQTCPRARRNVTLQTLPLSYSSLDLNLSFYYNCSGSGIGAVPIWCLSSGENESYVFVCGTEPAKFGNWYDFCEEKVVVTVKDSEINETMGFDLAMKDGFVLDWRQAAACGACEASGGRCGHNTVNDDYLCFCSDGSPRTNATCKGYGWNGGRKIGIGLGSTGGIMVIMLFCIIIKKLKQSEYAFFWKPKTENYRNIEAFLKNCGSLSPKRYTYSDIKKITNSFGTELGKGGFGSVFKGKLGNGCLVAVKVLKGLKGNGDDFINEVATISRTSHVHIVTLLGFCFEGSHRVLIYEFMPNGSLDKFINDGGSLTQCTKLDSKALYQIAVGIARGLEYLHRGCNMRILHFDIKPHNILLNEDFCPKISDFGLAKLCLQKESIISLSGARGTIGYIAPEVFSRNFGPISHKSDVYSYGMMVLEMVGATKNTGVEVDHTSEIYFPHWIYKRLELDEELGLHGIMDDEANASSRKLIIVGLWCIQTDPSHRPSMSRVVEMLEGSLKSLQIPPKPFLSSPPRAPVDFSSPLTS